MMNNVVVEVRMITVIVITEGYMHASNISIKLSKQYKSILLAQCSVLPTLSYYFSFRNNGSKAYCQLDGLSGIYASI